MDKRKSESIVVIKKVISSHVITTCFYVIATCREDHKNLSVFFEVTTSKFFDIMSCFIIF